MCGFVTSPLLPECTLIRFLFSFLLCAPFISRTTPSGAKVHAREARTSAATSSSGALATNEVVN